MSGARLFTKDEYRKLLREARKEAKALRSKAVTRNIVEANKQALTGMFEGGHWAQLKERCNEILRKGGN